MSSQPPATTHGIADPSPWVVRWATLLSTGGTVLDVACGGGRHARYFAAQGHPVQAVDRDEATLNALRGVSGVMIACADLESGPWPFTGRTFDAVVVTNYLHRPLFPQLLDAVAPGGFLIYETFALGNARYGRPANANFLLKPGELLERVRGRLTVVAYEDLYVDLPKPAMVQRICAVDATIGVQAGHIDIPR